MRRLTYTVTAEYDGRNLSFIFSNVLHLSGYLIRRNKHIENAVTVNGNYADVRTIVHNGDYISVLLSDIEKKSNVIPSPGPLNIVYEDEDIIALNKRAEDIVHPDHAHQDNTLGNYLMDYYARTGDPADFHPIQRLDNGTSGLVIFAKHSYAQNVLSQAMHTDAFTRRYIALCSGIIEHDTGFIDAPVFRPDSVSIKRCVSPDGQTALTEYQVVKRYTDMTLVKLTLHTGRTHQIRVHMSYIGHPLIGDSMYGGITTDFLTRPALHSFEADLFHPVTNEKMLLSAPIANDISAQMQKEDIKWNLHT